MKCIYWEMLEHPKTARGKILCRCFCGKLKNVFYANIRSYKSLSCGCLGEPFKDMRHERRAWSLMRYRCNKKTSPDWPNYGGRGIKVCERWQSSVINFIQDLGPAPSEFHTVERVNNDQDYSPENCIWATFAEQALNKRNTRRLSFNNQTKCLSEWSRITGIGAQTIRQRLKRGWSTDRALTIPPDKRFVSCCH